jgi:hypothetical protein
LSQVRRETSSVGGTGYWTDNPMYSDDGGHVDRVDENRTQLVSRGQYISRESASGGVTR